MKNSKFMATLIKGLLAALVGALSTLVGVKMDAVPLGMVDHSVQQRVLHCDIMGRFPVSASCTDQALLAASNR